MVFADAPKKAGVIVLDLFREFELKTRVIVGIAVVPDEALGLDAATDKTETFDVL